MTTPLIEAIARALHDGDHPDDIMEWPEHSDSWRANYARSAQAALTAITEAGYRVTPAEPTEAMIHAGCAGIEGNGAFPASLANFPSDSQWVAEAYCCYRAMISAAQGDG